MNRAERRRHSAEMRSRYPKTLTAVPPSGWLVTERIAVSSTRLGLEPLRGLAAAVLSSQLRAGETAMPTARELLASSMGRRTSRRRPRSSAGTKRDDSGERNYAMHCRVHGLPEPISRYAGAEKQFSLQRSDQSEPTKSGKPRVWRFDFAWPDYGLIVEIDGGVWIRGAHSHPVDILRNMAKRNDATLAGFQLLAFTPQQVLQGHAIAFTVRTLARLGWQPQE